VCASSSGPENVCVLLGDGNEGFGSRRHYGAGTTPVSVIVCDFDRDGDSDLLTANRSSGDISVITCRSTDTPVEAAFYAVATDAGFVSLQWTVGSLGGIEGFRIYRATSNDGPFLPLTEHPIPAISPGSYTDTTVWPETTFWYELRAVFADGSDDLAGRRVYFTTDGQLVGGLHPPHPNPFSGSTMVYLDVPHSAARAVAAVYNVGGQLVKKLETGPLSRGRHELRWDGTDARGMPVSEGVYFFQARVGPWDWSRKVVLLR